MHVHNGFIVTFMDASERSIEDSVYSIGPFADADEACKQAEEWARENYQTEDGTGTEGFGWTGSIYGDHEFCAYYIVQMLRKLS